MHAVWFYIVTRQLFVQKRTRRSADRAEHMLHNRSTLKEKAVQGYLAIPADDVPD